MAASIRKSGAAPALAALAVLALLGQAPCRAAKPAQQSILLDADSSELDYRNNELLFHKVKISQGPMSVAAEQAHASGLDFDNSHWVFTGNVKIITEQGQLNADEADVTFANKLLVTAVVSGKPAVFEQHNAANGKPVHGHAEVITYDVPKGLVRLTKGAWLSDGQNEIRGEALKYNIAEQKMIADAAEQNSQRVHITITPPPAQPAKP